MAVALLTVPGEGDADGEGPPGVFELELLPGSAAQPAATIERAMISPRVVCLIVFILEYLVADVNRRDVGVSVLLVCSTTFAYFGPRPLALGEGDAASAGLAAGLGLLAGALSVAPLGEADVDGDGLAVFGEFELSTGSVAQPAANTIENIVRSRSAVRLIMFMFGVLISFLPRSSKIEERDDNCPAAN